MSGLLVHDLVVGRAGFRLGPLDLNLRPGALLAVIGPNGSGKTTLLKTLAGLVAPLSGRVETSAAAYLPPPGAVHAEFATRHVVALGRAARVRWAADLSAADRQTAGAALDRMGLTPLADRPFDRLSSGQQQRALFARMIVQEASLCLLDEPLALLDPAQARTVAAAIEDLRAEGRTVLVSTHDLAWAATADLVLALGARPRLGPPDSLLSPEAVAALYDPDHQGRVDPSHAFTVPLSSGVSLATTSSS